ncbi:response regulator transcription factor [Sphingosinithalassobacter sp. CS137]|uniref:response regulator transcription factor n=1 Tax=Sphingosinithalassobacter sp. CS137 TaxID=2762748 RepID=UPI0021D344B3|nr:response regulator transcription factor [Sphingosinithalassobacter sp. CS137]
MACRLSHGWPTIALYGGALALGTAALQWLDYQRMVRSNSDDVVIFVIALAFLALGVFAGMRLLPRAGPRAFDGNPAGREALGISPREYEVLLELAAGRSNKEIARALGVSPNTVKTHVARLYAKLKATRRTDAVAKARALGIVR